MSTINTTGNGLGIAPSLRGERPMTDFCAMHGFSSTKFVRRTNAKLVFTRRRTQSLQHRGPEATLV